MSSRSAAERGVELRSGGSRSWSWMAVSPYHRIDALARRTSRRSLYRLGSVGSSPEASMASVTFSCAARGPWSTVRRRGPTAATWARHSGVPLRIALRRIHPVSAYSPLPLPLLRRAADDRSYASRPRHPRRPGPDPATGRSVPIIKIATCRKLYAHKVRVLADRQPTRLLTVSRRARGRLAPSLRFGHAATTTLALT